MIALGSAIATLALLLSVISSGTALTNGSNAEFILMAALFVLAALRIPIYLREEKTKVNLIKNIAMSAMCFLLAIFVALARFSLFFISIPILLYCQAIIVNRIILLINHHEAHSIVLSILIMLVAIVFTIGYANPYAFDSLTKVTPLNLYVGSFGLIVIGQSFKEVITFVFIRFKFKVFFNIIKKTFAAEILMGLVVLIVAFSIVFVMVEPDITNFGDALWYCFAIVTTIGFGDYHTVTVFGRILSVVLGIYGIVVVALLTSIIVNFYNEVSRKVDAEEYRKEARKAMVEIEEIKEDVQELSDKNKELDK